MNREESLKKLAEQIQETPSKVNPDLWANISSQIGTGAAAGTASAAAAKSGWSIGTWVATSIVGTGAIVASVVLLNQDATDTVSTEKAQSALVETPINTDAQNESRDEIQAVQLNTTNEENSAEIEVVESIENQEVEPSADELKRDQVVNGDNAERNLTSGLDAPARNQTADQSNNHQKNSQSTKNNKTTQDDFINSLQDTPTTAEAPKKDHSGQQSQKNVADDNAGVQDDVVKDESTKIVGGIDQVTNIFTPNNDRNNDEFFIESHGLVDFSLVIMDQKGQVIWKTQNPEARWNGIMLNGQPAPDGTYIYMIAAKDANDNPISASQRLQIVR